MEASPLQMLEKSGIGVAAQLTNTLSNRDAFLGTPQRMAPEVLQKYQYDGKVLSGCCACLSCVTLLPKQIPHRCTQQQYIWHLDRDNI